jgi:hypothetical protein
MTAPSLQSTAFFEARYGACMVLAQSFPGAWLSSTRHSEFRIDSWSRT